MTFSALALQAADAVQADRLEARLRGLARFGARSDGGVDRQALTPEEFAARRWLVEPFARKAGYVVGIDDAANVFVRRAGTEPNAPAVLTGSHADTQPAGGWLDGAFGVGAGLEVFDALDAAGVCTTRPIEVVVWTNEEGCRFSPGLMGSNSFADPSRWPALGAVTDSAGIRFADACAAARADFHAAADAGAWALHHFGPARPLHAYVEAHIEQGPVLEAARQQVGCVHTIQGVRWFELQFQGRSAHAGTTPSEARDDAMVKAVRAAHAVLAIAEAKGDPQLRLTIGRFEAWPASINTIAREVRFTIDLRHPDPRVLDAVQAALQDAWQAQEGEARLLLEQAPVPFDARLHAMTIAACEQLNLTHQPMLSGAFHDAMPLAACTPTVMLFAPSKAGLSHNPAEDTAIDDLTACTRALALCITQLALEA